MRASAVLAGVGVFLAAWGSGGYLPRPAPPSGSPILRIPRLNLEAPVFPGDSGSVFSRGIGNIPGTAAPGEPGNIALAGHRDTFFRPLKDIRAGDSLQLETPSSRIFYRVDSIRVTAPSGVSVLAPSRQNVLTLVTCHPFHYAGHAPRRFIVRARETARLTRHPIAP